MKKLIGKTSIATLSIILDENGEPELESVDCEDESDAATILDHWGELGAEFFVDLDRLNSLSPTVIQGRLLFFEFSSLEYGHDFDVEFQEVVDPPLNKS